MKAAKGKRLGGAPRRGRWARKPPPPVRRVGYSRTDVLVLFGLGFLILGAVAGFGWEMRRQLDGGILRQRTAAVRRPDWVPLAALPPVLPRMVVSVVDPGFMGREALDTETDAPSLTRNLVEQVYMLDDGLRGEAREMMMTPLLDTRLPRRDLLELYLNRVYFGKSGGWPVYGVYHAAREYFNKDPRALTVSESATLAGLLLEPRISDPEQFPGVVGVRRNEVLRRMLDAGAIDQATFRAAVGEPLAFQPGVEYAPMSRPLKWQEPPPTYRLPAQTSPAADSSAARPGA